MATKTLPEAWIPILSETEAHALMPPELPYDFGFIPAMARLLMTHDTIGPAFMALMAQVQYAPGHLSRREHELVASVASAAQDCHY